MSLDKDGKVVDINSATQRLIDVATKGEEKVSTALDLLNMWSRNELAAEALVNIYAKNGVWAEILVTAVAQSLGVFKLEPGWIMSEGGSCPIDQTAFVKFRLRNGMVVNDWRRASDLRWHFSLEQDEIGNDIVAYTVFEEKPDDLT